MDFILPAQDLDFLNNKFKDKWQSIISNNEQGVIVTKYSLPKGYSQSEVDIMILIPKDYPMAQLDMFYILPEITKTNNTNIKALNKENHFDKQWQRWSRHYDWQPGIYNIATHFHIIEQALVKEVQK